MHEIRHAIIVCLALAIAPLQAQMQSRPTDPPLVTAVNESWYQLREPVQFAGDLYSPAGAAVFFNGNTMVRTGHYNGVPLYADTTLEPFSVIYVPISRGLMQPYARLRRADQVPIQAPVSPTAPPLPPGAISVYTPERAGSGTREAGSVGTTGVVGTTGIAAVPRPIPRPLVTARRPQGNDGIWIQFAGGKWISGGPAIPMGTTDLVRIGEYAGFPVYAPRQASRNIIYLPTRPGLVAPYRLKD